MRCAMAMILIGLAWTPPAAAQPVTDYVRSCAVSADKTLCESSRRQFLQWYPRAFKRDYQGQRNVAFCLSTGCDDAVSQDHITACAWRMVLKAAQDQRYDAGDRMNFDVDCGDRRLETTERADAARIAQTLYKRIYGRELPLERLSKP